MKKKLLAMSCLCLICAYGQQAKAGLIEGKFGFSGGFFLEQQRGRIEANNTTLWSGSSALFKKPISGFYVGAGYNIYINLAIVKPFVGIDLQYRQSFSQKKIIENNEANLKFREWFAGHIKAGVRINFIGLQPYILFGTNYGKTSMTCDGIKDKDKYGGFGYSVGTGLEWMFLSFVGIRLEYRHTINSQEKNIAISGVSVKSHAKIRTNNVSLGAVIYL